MKNIWELINSRQAVQKEEKEKEMQEDFEKEMAYVYADRQYSGTLEVIYNRLYDIIKFDQKIIQDDKGNILFNSTELINLGIYGKKDKYPELMQLLENFCNFINKQMANSSDVYKTIASLSLKNLDCWYLKCETGTNINYIVEFITGELQRLEDNKRFMEMQKENKLVL